MYGKDGEIRLVDFGLSKECRGEMTTYAGTPYFMAPEVINELYTHKCDIWSLGCVLYMIVSGKLPFEGFTKPEVFAKIKKGQYKKPPCSDLCADLISQMLNVDETKRPTAAECYKHAWFQAEHIVDATAEQVPIPLEVVNALKNFQGSSSLRRACLTILVKMMNPAEFANLR